MKTFEIFLRSGTVARVIAAKMERKALQLDGVDGPLLAFTSADGEVVAQFTVGEVAGVAIAPASTSESP